MKEDFIHYAWRTTQFDIRDLLSTSNQSIHILEIGLHNHYAGPDFSLAKIKIDDEIWAGSIEMHIRASDWNKHGHQHDRLYENVILHVVWEHDCDIVRMDGTIIPCLVLKNLVFGHTEKAYRRLLASSQWIPCYSFYGQTDEMIKFAWYDRLMTEKLEVKINLIDAIFESTNKNREQTFFQLLFRNFGFGINNDFFEDLSTRINYLTILKNRSNIRDIEAILFGVAGLLIPSNLPDDYSIDLFRRYKHLQIKYGLVAKQSLELHFFKLRPPNFPTIRLAQLSAFLFGNQNLWSKVMAAKDVNSIQNMFDIEVSSYWKIHYHFGKISKSKSKRNLSKSAVGLIIMNTIVPFMFHYGRSRNDDQWIFKAFDYLNKLPAEKNSIITKWKELGVEPKSAFETQALLFLKKQYCDKKQCLRCPIAHQWMKNG